MRILLLLAVLFPSSAQADLYRWRDPQTGSIKFSNHPPPWYGDPVRELGFPRVEVVPDLSTQRRPAVARKPESQSMIASLEAQFAALLQSLKASIPSMPSSADFERSSVAFQQQAEMYQAVIAELDRMDPAGAARRRAAAQEAGLFSKPPTKK